MTIKPSLLEDQFVDMAFITRLTGLTDKWFYKLPAVYRQLIPETKAHLPPPIPHYFPQMPFPAPLHTGGTALSAIQR